MGALLEFGPMRDLFTMILAGGKGERLHPLTDQRAKPAVPFGGKYRIIDITLSNCINSGLRQIAVLIQYKSHSLDRHIRMGWNIFSTELGEYIISVPPQQRISEDWYKGTADAVYQNLFLLDNEQSPYLLVLAGDHIYKMNYADMYQFMLENKADAVVGAIECPLAEATRFGVIGVDENYRIQRFDEKPKDPMHIPGDPGQRAQKDGRVPGHAARQLRVRPGPEQDHPVRPPGAGERVAEALRHRENGHEDGDDARDPDHDHQRGAEPLGQGPEIEERDPGDLLEGAHRRPSQRCPARASTIRRRCARSAGGRPIASPSASTISAPMSHVSAVT